MAKKEEKLSLEQILEKLDITIEKLQSGDVSLEESFELYKKGMDYVNTHTPEEIAKIIQPQFQEKEKNKYQIF